MLAVIPAFLPPILMLLMFAAIFTAVFSVKQKHDKHRTKAMEASATSMGLSFMEKDSLGLTQQLKEFDLLRRERRMFRNGKISNVMRGLVGETDVYLFDYTYVVSTGKSARRVSQTVFFANDKRWYLPNFKLRPENWWHKIVTGMGMDKDINFEDNKAFSEKFWLKSEFENVVRQQFTPELQQFMMERPPVHLEGKNYYLLAYKPNKLVDIADIRHFFENCCALTKLMQSESEGKLELLQLVDIKQPELIKKAE